MMGLTVFSNRIFININNNIITATKKKAVTNATTGAVLTIAPGTIWVSLNIIL